MSNGHDIQKTPTANSALAKARTSRMSTSSTTLFLAILAAVLIVLPFVASDYWIDVCVFWGINALLSPSLNIILGVVGLFNMGHSASYAIGAYTTAILSQRFGINLWIRMVLSGLTAALAGYILTAPIMHLRGDYLLVVTIGLNEMIRITLINNPFGLTGGPNGLLVLDQFRIFGKVIQTPRDFYVLVWACVAVLLFSLFRLQRSRIGRAWNYVREDPVAAESTGVDTRWAKALAFTIGAGIAGATGTIYAAKMMVISPDSFTFAASVMLFAIVILGGTGSIPGVILASGAMLVLPEVLRDFARYRMLFFGLAMVLMMIFRPQGLWPSTRWTTKMRESGGK